MKQTSLSIRLEGKLEQLKTLGEAAAQLDRVLSDYVPDREPLQSLVEGMDRLSNEEPAFLEACAAFERLRESATPRDLEIYQLARRRWTELHDEVRRLVPPERRTTLAGDWAHLRTCLPRYVALKRELLAFRMRRPGEDSGLDTVYLLLLAVGLVVLGAVTGRGWLVLPVPALVLAVLLLRRKPKRRFCLKCANEQVEPPPSFDDGCPGCGRTARSVVAEMNQLLGWPSAR